MKMSWDGVSGLVLSYPSGSRYIEAGSANQPPDADIAVSRALLVSRSVSLFYPQLLGPGYSAR